jgi:hypothetical protein
MWSSEGFVRREAHREGRWTSKWEQVLYDLSTSCGFDENMSWTL